MPHKPDIIFHIHGRITLPPAPLQHITKADMRPKLAMGSNADTVPNEQTAMRIKNAVWPIQQQLPNFASLRPVIFVSSRIMV